MSNTIAELQRTADTARHNAAKLQDQLAALRAKPDNFCGARPRGLCASGR